MKKRFLTILFSIATMLMCIFGLAACDKVKFKISFVVENEVYATVSTSGNEVISMPENPTKDDYTFDGWYWDENTWQEPFTAKSLLNAPLSSNMSVYAKFTEANSVKGTDIAMNGYTLKEDESLGKVYFISVPNEKIVYAVSNDVTVHNKSTWTLSTDISGNNIIASKTVELSVGNNIYYILVEDNANNVEQYIIVIRRRPIYAVLFNTNGGSYCETQMVEEESLAIMPDTPTKTGYTFAEWDWNFDIPVMFDMVVSASWTANTYSIYYDANGGTISKTEQSVEYNQNYTLLNSTRNGYTFKGWYKGTKKVVDGKWTSTEDWYLTAQWTANSNAITYNLNGGENHTKNPSSYKTGTTVMLGKPTKTGYTFVGWTTDEIATPTEEISISAEDYGKKSFTANWTANEYTVTYNANGGTANKETDTATYDSEFTLATAEQKGYTFVGWYNGNTKIVNGDWKIAKDVELTAKWDITNYPITYILDGGTSDNKTSYTYETETFSLNEPTKTGYTFDGWTYDGQDTPVKTVTIDKGSIGDRSYTAHWTANDYTVTYNANDGTASKKTDTATYDSEFILATAERTGYTFVGWYNGNAKVVNGAWKIATDITLTAKWTANTYKISYDVNGGTLSSTQQSVTYDKAYTLKEPTRTGYTFLYWAYNGEEFTNGTWNLTNSVTLVAEWKANEYTVTYNTNGGECDITSDTVTYDSTYTVPVTTRVGYTFDGWYSGSTEYFGGTWRTANNIALTAKWIAHTNIPYTVNHYLQNIEDDDYTFDSTQDFTGTSDDYVTPSVNTYTGFTSPTAQTVKVNPDGSRVVDYYYTRNYYTLTLITNGGTGNNITRKYQADITDMTEWSERESYTFGGWFTNERLLSAFNNVEMPANNRTLYAWWTEESKPADFTYTGSTEITISGYVGTSSTMWIPTYIGGRAVTTILEAAFENKTELVKVAVPDTVTSIGLGAFKGCNAIEDITLPFVGASANATYYDAVFGYIFGYTTIKTLNYNTTDGSNHYSTTGSNAYIAAHSNTQPADTIWQYSCRNFYGGGGTNSYGYRLQSYYYYIPTSIKNATITVQTDIPVAAFNNCDFIETITLSPDVETIGDYAFQNCGALKRLNSTADGVFNIPESVTGISNYAFYGCAKLTTLILGNNVKTIGGYSFSGCSLLSKVNSENENELIMPSKVESIGQYAFQDILLARKVVVADSVTNIGLGAFKGCNAIEDITLPFVGASINATYYDAVFGYIFGYNSSRNSNSYKWASEYTEADKEYKNEKYGTLEGVWQYTAYSYKFTNGYGTKYILESRYFCIPSSIKNVTITVQTDIPVAAFNNCDFIETITLSPDVENIGDYAFQNCNATIQYA